MTLRGEPSHKRLKLDGQVFGRWTALYRIEGQRPCKWFCRCECGTEKQVRQDLLVEGKSTSCRQRRRAEKAEPAPI
jgi:hypothetical protein